MDGMIKGGDKLGSQARPTTHLAIAHVAGLAKPGLSQFQLHGGLARAPGRNGLLVALEATGSDPIPSSGSQAVSGCLKTSLSLLMTFPAGLGLAGTAKGKGRILDREHFVGVVTLRAIGVAALGQLGESE